MLEREREGEREREIGFYGFREKGRLDFMSLKKMERGR